ncbi:hypothetical protein LMH87_011051 [Akanthomyces muscarius]|uniref:Uncharacterized protein n=1 Tax=Akanthomyces muscarius TaxID=2231603 RepID=A0A9W8Q8Y9_AKAMU|nr:hypothetical protein LMH87_011051 [Akanthomyces muscarius]KAJ4150295.1 hypothetical protein LMH87_011051 [Akanthomyces muscarius]
MNQYFLFTNRVIVELFPLPYPVRGVDGGLAGGAAHATRPRDRSPGHLTSLQFVHLSLYRDPMRSEI